MLERLVYAQVVVSPAEVGSCYGSYASADAAKGDLAEVRKSFKDAYVVRYEGDKLLK